MNPLFAMLSSEHSAFNVGVLIVVAFCASVLALAIICVMPFAKRTRGWIVAGSISGVVLLFIIGTAAIGFTRGFTNVARERDISRVDSRGPKAVSTKSASNELVQGHATAYSIRIPQDWTIKRTFDDFDIYASQKNVRIGVIAEEGNLGSPEVAVDLLRERINKISPDAHWTAPTPVVVDGRTWLQFSVEYQVKKVPFTFVYYVYAGTEGTYQIVGGTMQNLAEKHTPKLKELSQTFRFPK
jgi:hypothetical protein